MIIMVIELDTIITFNMVMELMGLELMEQEPIIMGIIMAKLVTN